jgi:hypothetical protein
MAERNHYIDIVLRLRDEFAKNMRDVTGSVGEFRQEMNETEREVGAALDRLDKSSDRSAKSLRQMRQEGHSMAGTLAQAILQADRKVQHYSDSVEKARRETRGLDKDSEAYKDAERKINHVVGALEKWRDRQKELNALLKNDERATQLDREAATVERMSKALAKMRANEKISIEEIHEAERNYHATVANLIRLRKGVDDIMDSEVQNEAKLLAAAKLREYQEEEILAIRKRGEAIAAKMGRDTDVRSVIRHRRELDQMLTALARVAKSEQQIAEIRDEWSGIEAQQMRARGEKEHEAALRRQVQLERARGSAIQAAAKARMAREEAETRGFSEEVLLTFRTNEAKLIEEAEKAHAILEAAIGKLDVPVDVDMAEAIAQITAFNMLKDRAGAAPGGGGGGIRGFLRNMSDEFEHSTNRIATFDNFMRGMMTLAIAVFFNQLVVLAGGAAGALAALASSAAFAAGAIGGTLTAGLAQALPMLGIFAATVNRIGGVMDAVKQANLLRQQQSYQGAQQDRAAANAADQVTAAHGRVADTARRVVDAQKKLNESRVEAKRRIEELILAERGAVLSVQEAQEALRAAQAGGRVEDLPRADLQVDESQLRLRRVREELRNRRAGQNPEVAAATEQLRDARRAASEAQRGLERAKSAADAAGAGTTAAAGKLNFLLGEMSDAERALYGAMTRLQNRWKRVSQDITEPMITGVTNMVTRVTDLLGNRQLVNSFGQLSERMSQSMQSIFNALTDEESLGFFQRMNREARRNLGPITRIFISISEAFEHIADAAAPALHFLLVWFDQVAARFAEWTGNKNKMEDFFSTGAAHLQAWMRLGGAVVRLFMAIAGVGGGAATGLSLITRMTDKLNEMSESIRESPAGMQRFFGLTVQVLEAVWPVLVRVGEAFLEMFSEQGVKNVEAMANFFIDVLIPAFEDFMKITAYLFGLLNSLAEIPLFREAMRWGIALALVLGILGKMRFVLIPLKAAIIGLFAISRITGFSAALAGLVASMASRTGLVGVLGTALTRVGEIIKRMRGASTAAGALPAGMETYRRNLGGAPAGGGASRLLGAARAAAVPVAVVSAAAGVFNMVRQAGKGPEADSYGDAVGRNFSRMTFGLIPDPVQQKIKESEKLLGRFSGKLNELYASKNIEGIRQFARQMDALGKTGLFSKETLGLAQDQMNDFMGLLNGLRNVGKSKDEFAFAQLTRNIEDFARKHPKAKTAISTLRDELRGLRTELDKHVQARNLGIKLDLQIQRDPKQIDKYVRGFLRDLKKLEPGARSVGVQSALNVIAGLASQGKITEGEAKRQRDLILRQYRIMRVRAQRQAGTMAKNVGLTLVSLADATARSMGYMGSIVNDTLKAFDAKPVKFLATAGANALRGRGGIAGLIGMGLDAGLDGAEGNARGGFVGMRRAVGGWIGRAGERGRDLIHTVLGRGEVVLNHWQQRAANAAMSGRDSLDNIVHRVRGYHAGGPEQPGFAGGFAGKSPAGYKTVPIPGFGGEFIAARVLKDAMNLIRRFNLFVTDAFATSGHVGAGHLRTGTAIDVTPADGNWDNVDRAVAYARRRGLTVLYNGVAGHGRGHHAHIELQPGTIKGGAFAGADFKGAPKITISGKGPFKEAAQNAVDRARRAMNRYLDKQIGVEEHGTVPHGVRDYKGPLDRVFKRHFLGQPGVRLSPGQVARLATRAGLPGQTFAQIAHGESDYYPGVQQRDPGDGMVGYGLWQMTPNAWGSGSAAYKHMQRLGGIAAMFNPWKNALMAKYLYDAAGGSIAPWYGTKYVTGARKALGGFAGSFDTGGEIPGQLGQAWTAIVHGKEWIVNQAQQAKLAAMAGMSRDKLKGALGFTGGPTSFAGGGEPSYLLDDRKRAANRGRFERVAGLFDARTIEEALREIMLAGRAMNVAFRLVKSWGKKGKEAFKNWTGALNVLVRDGGLIDVARANIESETERSETATVFRRFRIKYNDLIKKIRKPLRDSMSELTAAERDVEAAARTVDGHRQIMNRVRRTQRQVNTRLNRYQRQINARERSIDRLERGDEDDDQKKDIKRLKSEVDRIAKRRDPLQAASRRLGIRLNEARDSFAQALADLYEKQVAQFQAQLDSEMKPLQSAQRGAEVFQRVSESIGTAQGVAFWSDALLQNQRDQKAKLEEKLTEANARGYTEIADELTGQIQDLWASIQEGAAKQVTRLIDSINNEAARIGSRLDLQGRMVDVAALVNPRGAALLREGLNSRRGAALGGQRDALLNVLGGRGELNRLEALPLDQLTETQKNLINSILDLDVQIMENTAQQKELEVATRQASIDAVLGRSSFLSGAFGALQQLSTTIGGEGAASSPFVVSMLQAARTSLETARGGLLSELLGASGGSVDLRGLTGQGLAEGIADTLNRWDTLTANMTESQRDQFNSLIQQLIDNENAIYTNTNQINELTGAMDTQTFSSAGWRMFRQAIFTGSGGLLPEYNIPQLATGGFITKTGLFELHAGEAVINSSGDNLPVQEGDVNVNVNMVRERADPMEIAHRTQWARRTRGRR